MTFRRLPFETVFADESGGNIKTQQGEYLPDGEFPIIDQGKALIGGYTDDRERLCGQGRSAIVFGDHTRCIKYIDFPFCMGADGVKVLRPRIEADLKYLYYFLKSIDIPSAGYDRHYKYLKRTEVALPPLPEQRRIAAILDQADALRAKRREALAQLDSLTQSIFIEMFGDEVTNFKALAKRPLRDLIQVRSGDFLPASAMFPDGEVPVFGGNGVNGFHNVAMFDRPKIVIGRVGAYCGCVHTTPNKSWVTDNALYVSRIDESLHFEYLAFALLRANLNRVASQSGQPLVSASRIYPVEILVPPVDSQHTFAARAQAVEALKATHRAALTELEALFASLQHRAFSGKL